MTRTALYVSQPTTLTFSPNTSTDKTAKIQRFPTRTSAGVANGEVTLAQGIYLIQSQEYVSVNGPYFRAEVSIQDKDEWPDPPHNMSELAPSATAEDFKLFFTISKLADGPAKIG